MFQENKDVGDLFGPRRESRPLILNGFLYICIYIYRREREREREIIIHDLN